MTPLIGSTYHQQQQARAIKIVPRLEKAVRQCEQRLATVQANRTAYRTAKGYAVALTGAKNGLAHAKKRLAETRGIAAGRIKPYWTAGGQIEWK